MPTDSMEDYLGRVYRLIKSKGYARVVDIAEWMGVQQPSVTKMMQRLDEQGLVRYERYRGLVLTPEGEQLAKNVIHRHNTIARFLELLGVPQETIDRDVEGMEHHVSRETVRRIARLSELLADDPSLPARLAGD